MSLVNVSIVGNVVRTPEQIQFSNGQTKTIITVAVNNPIKPGAERDAEFYKVEAWGRLGDVVHKYVSKGSQVGATGRLVLEKWVNREGRDRITPTIRAEQISLPQRLRVVPADEANSHNGAPHQENEFNFADASGSDNEYDEALGVGCEPKASNGIKSDVIVADFNKLDSIGSENPPASSSPGRRKAAIG